MTTTEAIRSEHLRSLVSELLADDLGREALMRIVVEELAARTVRVRRLEVVDELGRVRVETTADRSHGGVRVNSFSDWDELGRKTYVEISAHEENGEAEADLHLVAAGNMTALLGTSEDGNGGTGKAYLAFEEHRAGRDHRHNVTLSIDEIPAGATGR